MTAAQSSIALKGSRSFGNMVAVVVIGVIVAIVVVAISVRSLAAPATLAGHTSPLTLGHDESRFTAPALTTGHDEARPSSVDAQPGWYIPGQSQMLHQNQPAQFPAPTVPLTPRGGGSDRGH